MNETVRIVLCYIVFFAYMLLILAVGEFLQKKFNLDKEMCRKGEHLASGLCWLICCLFLGVSVHTFIMNAIGLALLIPVIFLGSLKSVERKDAGKSYGIVYFAFSTLVAMGITVFFNQDFFWFTGIAYYCMVLGDGFAPIFARLAGRFNFKITEKKTAVGYLTVFALSCLVTMTFSLIAHLQLTPLMVISVGALAAEAEVFSEKGTDNLTLEFAVFGYLVLNYYGLATLPLQWTLIVSLPLVAVDGALKVFTPAANCLAYIFFVLSAFFGGTAMIVCLVITFALSAAIGKVTNAIYNRNREEKVSLSRKAMQIFAVTFVTLACVTAHYFSKVAVILWAAYVALAEQFADTAASDVGKLSKKPPRDIVTMRQMTAGLSGGVSVIGTLGAFLFGAAVLVIPFAFGVFDWRVLLAGVALSFFGTLIDSVLGSRLQVLYRCAVCGERTERKEHCGERTEYVKGIKFLDNSGVNLVSGILTAAIASGVLLLF